MSHPASSPQMMFADVAADYDIVIVGSGPGGLSAAARARALGCRHVLLEAEQHASDTIYNYQKRKYVMAEPSVLPLRSDMPFGAGLRETVLDAWNSTLSAQQVCIEYGKRVSRIQRDPATGCFTIGCEDGSTYTSRTVILGIGVQGNVRKLSVPGEELARVQYTLSDPDEFEGESIVVIGAGDAGIENALALARSNAVYLFNRNDEFAVCKDRNRDEVLAADKSGRLSICYSASTVRIEEAGGVAPLRLIYNGKNGEATIACHRVIARLGATPPRKLVESFGIVFPNQNADAVPALSETYESNVPGLFIVGALGGYPLIKEAMNQGYEVVQTIMGQPVTPVDEGLLREKFGAWRPEEAASTVIDLIKEQVPLFRALTRLQLREFLLDSRMCTPAKGEVVFRKFDYTDTFYSIVEGEVECEVGSKDGAKTLITLHAGQYFGEMALISGRRRTATVYAGRGCVLLETPRRSMLKLIASVDDVQQQMDAVFVRNALASYLGPAIGPGTIDALIAGGIEARRYAPKQALFHMGDQADGLYLIRRGSVTVSRVDSGREQILSYISAGHYVGEMALVNNAPRSATVTATVLTEVLVLKADSVREQLARNPEWQKELRKQALQRTRNNLMLQDDSGPESGLIRFLVGEGMGEASDVLLIDESLCIHCNNCERACAGTHNGTSRLRREIGPTHANIHLPSACRHCEHPHCMKDCPPDAISRSSNGEVFISDACIGCGNCERNCPYGVIQMASAETPKKASGLGWLLALAGVPGRRDADANASTQKKAVKCDLCAGQKGGAACVRACPTGAAMRTSPEKLFRNIARKNQR